MSELAPLHTSLESLAHRTAKGALLLWLRDAASTAGYDHEARLGRLAWRVNRGGPHYGIWSEYPIVAGGNGNERVWDELDERWFGRPPSYDELVIGGVRPMAIFDIAIQERGRLSVAIEIRHKHPIDPLKRGLVRKLGMELIEVPAYWVLGQVERPGEIPDEFWLL